MKQGFLGQPDDAFWADPMGTVDGVIAATYEGRALGLGLDAPREVRLRERDELPLVAVRAIPLTARGQVPIEWCGVVAAVVLETGEVLAARAYEPKGVREQPPARTKEAFPGEPLVKAHTFDLRRRMRMLEWEPATLALTLVIFDERSNTVKVSLVERPIDDPEVAKFIAARRTIPLPGRVSPPQDEARTRYARSAASPPLPEAGLALSVERVVLLEAGARCVVHGSFRLPLTAGEVVPSAQEQRALGAGWAGVGDEEATGVVLISLLLTGRDVADPILVPLRVPTYTPLAGRTGGQVAEGHFAVDLLALPEVKVTPQTYAVYGLHGEHCSAPLKVAFVTPEMLPKPGH